MLGKFVCEIENWGDGAMKVLVSGASGLVGNALLKQLQAAGHETFTLVRKPVACENETSWDPESGILNPANLPAVDAVVNLAGESIAERWTAEKKTKIRDSRVNGTRCLSQALAEVGTKPKVLINASAIGFYGDRGNEILREDSQQGTNFLAGVCRQWEDATQAASDAGIRVIKLRTGVVLSTKGGALAKMLPPFKMGAGGPLGSGAQYMSWIDLQDLVSIIAFGLSNDALNGPVNAVSPQPVSNAEFTRVLGHVLHRPAFMPVPVPALHLLMGEMSDELLLASARVEPAKLQASGFKFQYPDLQQALQHALSS